MIPPAPRYKVSTATIQCGPENCNPLNLIVGKLVCKYFSSLESDLLCFMRKSMVIFLQRTIFEVLA